METLLYSRVDALMFSPPELGCVLYLSGLPNSGSKIHDRSPYSNHGAITGATWQRLPSGLWCLSFDGTDDKVDCGSGESVDIGTRDFTLEVWVKGSRTGTVEALLYKYISDAGYQMYFNSSNQLCAHLFDSAAGGASKGVVIYATNLRDGVWHHLVYTNIRSVATGGSLYVDGVRKATSGNNCITDLSQSANLYLGAGYLGGTQFFSGDVALPRVYNRHLGALEIQRHFNREKQLFGVW